MRNTERMMTMTSHRGRIKLVRTYQILEDMRESKKKNVVPESLRNGAHLFRSVPGRESHHSWDLKQTNLEGIRRTNFHTEGVRVSNLRYFARNWHKNPLPERNVSIQSERNGVHELGGVWYESKQGNPKELLIDTRSFEHNIHHIHKQFYAKRSVNYLSKKSTWTYLQ
jgi:hypothetical protein